MALTKTCKRCKTEKSLTDFYSHFAMADGYLSFCKSCVLERVRNERLLYPERIAERERKRNQKPARKAKKHLYLQCWRLRCPEGAKAHNAVARAIRKGLLKRGCCEICGTLKVDAHHDDYSKPLEVRWFCVPHHRDVHFPKFAALKAQMSKKSNDA